MAGVAFRNIHKSFGQTEVLKGIDLKIADGEFIALLGPSGCGKTTLLRLLSGLDVPDTGQVLIGGRDVTGCEPSDRNVALVFQNYALYPHKSVFENIAFPLRMQAPWHTRVPLLSRALPSRRRLNAALPPRVLEVARQVGIEALLDRKPGQLSGGQKQRVALARALVRHPDLFLMDEPLSNLDAKLRASMRMEIIELQRRLGATFIYVTHDQVEAMTMADRVVLLNDGVVQQVGPPMELYADPANKFVAEFIGTPTINMLDLTLSLDGGAVLGDLPVEGVPSSLLSLVRDGSNPLWVGLRPEDVEVDTDEQARMVAAVHVIEPHGNDTLLILRLVDTQRDTVLPQSRVVVRADPHVAAQLGTGARIRLALDWQKALIFDANGQRVRRQSMRAAA